MRRGLLPGLTVVVVILGMKLTAEYISPPSVKSATSHVVISQIQVGGATADDEFVELFNQTDSPADLTGWRLSKKTATSTSSANLVTTMSGTIPARAFFLIVEGPDYTGSVASDAAYSTSSRITANNTVTLYSDAGTTVVDKVGMGTAQDFEGAATISPGNGQSVERIDPFIDTDNNSDDFFLQTTPSPRNTLVTLELPTPTLTPTETPIPTLEPTAEPTVVPTETPTPTIEPTVEPTTEPTVTPTPTVEPTAEPTATSTPSPTIEPTVTPTPTVVPTGEPTATSTPTLEPTGVPTPTPTPPGSDIIFENQFVRCTVEFKTKRFFGLILSWPKIRCHKIKG